MNRVRYKLEYQKVIPYLEDNLLGANFLSSSIFEFLKSKKKGFFTLLPEGKNNKEIHSFKYGGLASGEKEHIKRLILNKIALYPELICILDNVNLTYKINYREEAFDQVGAYLNNEIYYVLFQKDILQDSPLFDRCIFLNDAIWHSLCVLFDDQSILMHQNQLSVRDVQKITNSAKFILIRAYDQEGYVIWEKS